MKLHLYVAFTTSITQNYGEKSKCGRAYRAAFMTVRFYSSKRFVQGGVILLIFIL